MCKRVTRFWTLAFFGVFATTQYFVASSLGQYLDQVPNFNPAFSHSFSSQGPNGAGTYFYRGPNGQYGSTTLGPYRMQQYVDLSNVPAYYGPMSDRYRWQTSSMWQRNDSRNTKNVAERPDASANPTLGVNNKKSDRLPLNSKNANSVSKSRADRIKDMDQKAKEIAENAKPIPFQLDENGRVPVWLVSAVEFIDRFVKAGEVVDALGACERLMATRTGLPSDVYTRAAILSFLDGRELDKIGEFIQSGTTDGARLSSSNLPGGSLEKYLSPLERRKFMERVAQLRIQMTQGNMSEEHMNIVKALLDL